MLFNSIEFWVFLAIVLPLAFLVPFRWRWTVLLAASYVFYAWWNVSYSLLMVVSTVLDYVVGRLIQRADRASRKKALILLSLTLNLGLLFTFKYWSFFHESMHIALGWIGVEYAVPTLDVLLPVGISFYTFQTLSYTLDVYRGHLTAERHFGRFALFVAFFPQLVAGPIERASTLLPQLRAEHRFDFERVKTGLQRAMWGLFKKVVIADRLALYVDPVYDQPSAYAASTYLLATYAFAFQIYCDFSALLTKSWVISGWEEGGRARRA